MSDLTLVAVLLYPDGHAIILFDKGDKGGKQADVVELFGPACNFRRGCLRLTKGVVDLVRTAVTVSARPAALETGSHETKSRDIKVSALHVRLRGSSHDLVLHSFPGLLDADWAYTPEAPGDFETHKVRPQFREYAVRRVWRSGEEFWGWSPPIETR